MSTGTGPETRPVVACVRPLDLRSAVDPLDGTVTRDDRSSALAPQEAAAVEHALRVAGTWGVGVRVIVGGPLRDLTVIDELTALGATVEVMAHPGGDPEGPVPDERLAAAGVARAIEAAGGASLVLCGDRSPDRGTGAFGAFLAHELGVAQALGLVSLEPLADRLIGERRLEGGWRERVVVPRPAVCSVEGGLRLRRAPLGALLAAAGTASPPAAAADAPGVHGPGVHGPAHQVTGGPASPTTVPGGGAREVAVGPPRPYRPRARVVTPPAGSAHQRLVALTGALVAHDPPALIGPVGASEAAAAILDYLERHGHTPPTSPAAPDVPPADRGDVTPEPAAGGGG